MEGRLEREEKSFAARQAKENKKLDRLEQMERKKQSLAEELEKVRRLRGQPENVVEEHFTLEKTKDQRDIEEEMERLIEEHKNDEADQSEEKETSNESQSSETAEKLEDFAASKSWVDLGRQDLDEEMNAASESGSQTQFQEVPIDETLNSGKVDPEDIFVKYSHVLQGNSGSEAFANDFDLSESDDEKTTKLSRQKFEEEQILKARDSEEMRRRKEIEIEVEEVDMEEEVLDDNDDGEEEDVLEVEGVGNLVDVEQGDDDGDGVEEDSVCQFTALNAGRAVEEVRLSETDSDSVPLEVRLSESGSEGEVVSLEVAKTVTVTLGSDSEEEVVDGVDSRVAFNTITTEIYPSSSSATRFNKPFNVLLETREEQVQSREDAEAANALAMDMDEMGEEGRRRGRVEEEERRRVEDEDERMRRREEEDVLRRVEEVEMRRVADEERILREKEEMLMSRGEEESRVEPEVTETKYLPPKMSESSKAEQRDLGKIKAGAKVGKKQARCGTCQGCASPNCNACKFCKDMKSNGGAGKQRYILPKK